MQSPPTQVGGLFSSGQYFVVPPIRFHFSESFG